VRGGDALVKVIPAEFLLDAHHWLILHGCYGCKAQAGLPGLRGSPTCAGSVKDHSRDVTRIVL
jgi:endonuclease III